MNNRYFAGRQISAEIYDGKTRYEKSGTKTTLEGEEDEAEKARLERYAKWLEEGGGSDEDQDKEEAKEKPSSVSQ